METLLVRERYKVVRVMDSREDYAFAEAVDILDREMHSCLLNVYEGPLLRQYLPCFDQLSVHPAFQNIFLEGESLVAVFQDCTGTPIDQVFYLGDEHSWRDRLYYAGELFWQALNLADLPPEVACALLLSENVLVDQVNRQLRLRFHMVPLAGMNPRETAYLAADQAKKILRPRLSSPPGGAGVSGPAGAGRHPRPRAAVRPVADLGGEDTGGLRGPGEEEFRAPLVQPAAWAHQAAGRPEKGEVTG